MNKNSLLLLLIFVSFNSFSQILFEKGYYIDNSNSTINCLIKNIDWTNNPTEFEYKLSQNGEIKTANIVSVKEFGVFNISKYVRDLVKIDRSSEITEKISYNKAPVFKDEQLFLKVIIEGKANLYAYKDGNLNRYFFNNENSKIEQLIFKSYKNETSDYKVYKNNGFKQQLWTKLKCNSIKENKIENLDYKKSSLTRFFTEYNSCINSDFINYEETEKKDLFNLTLRPRLNSSSLKINNTAVSSRNTNFNNETGFGFGVEAEFILPFNKNKWSILIEATYQKYESQKTNEVSSIAGGQLTAEIDYSSIEIPISLRHYFFLNNDSKIFANMSYIFDSSSKSSINFTRVDNSIVDSIDIKTRTNIALGLGYKLYDKYSVELRYQTGRELLSDYVAWNSDYNTLSVIFGYSIF